MNYGVKLADYGALWQQALQQEDGSYSPRTESDDEERKFWASFMGKRESYAPDAYSVPIADFVTALLRENQGQSVLEIGPGWGNYTIPLVKACTDVSCVDISPDVLAFLQRAAARECRSQIHTICSKWEDCVLTKPYDAVFAYNCFYRMRDLKACLEKIDRSAKKLCIIGMTSGPEPAFLLDFQRELGLDVRFSRIDYIYFTNLLYSLGIDVNCRIIPLQKEYAYDSMEEVLKRETERIRDTAYDQKSVQKIMERYYHPENGKYRFRHTFRAAVLYWEKELSAPDTE